MTGAISCRLVVGHSYYEPHLLLGPLGLFPEDSVSFLCSMWSFVVRWYERIWLVVLAQGLQLAV